MQHLLSISPFLVSAVFVMLCMNSLVMEARNTISSNETNRLAFLHFKGGITKDPLGGLRSWNNTLHFCDWNGIICYHQR